MLTHIEECLTTLAGQKVFSLLDLCSGYWQIPISEKDKHKTAFTTRGGLFEWNRLPFGLSNAPATFQRAMDLILRGLLWEECLVYIDDILIFGRDMPEHNRRLIHVLQRLSDAHLGHRISGEGIATSISHVEAVSKFPTPKTPADVQQFIGLVGFSRRFIRDFASKSRPTTEGIPGVETRNGRSANIGVPSA